MKRYLYLAAILICLLNNEAFAQKAKSKKDKQKDSINNLSVPIPPDDVKVISVEDATKYGYDTKEMAIVEAPVTVSEGDGYYSNRRSSSRLPTKMPLGNSGKYYLVTANNTGSDYYTKYGVVDSSGKIILPSIFSNIRSIDEGYIIKLGSYSSLLDTAFKTILPMEFENIEPIADKHWYIVKRRTGGTQVIDKNGVQQIPGTFKSVNMFSITGKPKTSYLLLEIKDYKRAIYNYEKNKFEVGFVAKNFISYETGVVIVEDTCTRIVDNNFKPITNETFTSAYGSRGSSVFVVTKKNKKGLLSYTGKYILPCEYDMIENTGGGTMDLFIISKNKKYTCVDYLGKNILGETYDLIKPLFSSYSSSNLLLVKSSNKMGIKDFLNHSIVPTEFDTIYNNYGNYYVAQKAKKVIRYSTQGNIVNEIDCDKIEPFTAGYSIYYINNKVGLLNAEFDIATKAEYDKIETLGNISSSSDYYYSKSNRIQGFRSIQNNRMGIISKKGEIIVPFKYDLIDELDSYTLLVKQNGKYGLIRSGDYKILAECLYDLIGNQGTYNSSKYVGMKNGEVTYFNN